jgi:putative copper resistance protein D
VTTVRPRPAARTTEPPTHAPTRPTATVVVAAATALIAVLVLALVVGGSLPARVAPGLPQAGPLVDWALPVVTFVARIAAVGTIGTLVFAGVLVPVTGPTLPDAGRRSLRAASGWATAWAVSTLLGGALTLARLVGTPDLTADSIGAFVGLPAGRTVLMVTALAAVVAVLARRCRTAFDAMAVLALAAAGVVGPVVTTGHSAAEGDHLLAIGVLGAHVLGASVWVGGLAALLLHGRGRDVLAAAASRFSAVALGCFLVVGGTGLAAAWVVLGSSAAGLAAAFGTGYGALLLVKTIALLVLGGFGAWHRRRTLPRLRVDRPGAFRRFAVVEVAVMLATVAVAVALAASPPPRAAASASPPASSPAPAPGAPTTGPMAGHDHGKLSVGVLIDGTRFHVPGPVAAGSTVTVFNSSDTDATLTADDGAFDVDVPGHALVTFPAPDRPGSYEFGSRADPAYRDVLVVE